MDICRVDSNQAEIVKKLRRHKELSVWDTHTVGRGFPDIIVGIDNAFNPLFEIKKDWKSKLTPAEIKFKETWKGEYYAIFTYEQACFHLGIKPMKGEKI